MITYYELLGNEVNDLYIVRRTLLRIISDLEVISGFVDSGDINCSDLLVSSDLFNCIQKIKNCCFSLFSLISEISTASSLLTEIEKSLISAN